VEVLLEPKPRPSPEQRPRENQQTSKDHQLFIRALLLCYHSIHEYIPRLEMPRDESDRERRRRHSSHDPEDDRERRKDADRQRRRRTHRATDSQGELLPKHGDRSSRDYDSPSTPRRKRRDSSSKGGSSSNPLRSGSLAQLDSLNAKQGWNSGGYDAAYLQEVRDKENRLEKDRRREERGLEKERRQAEREAVREERRRIQELEEQKEVEAERQRVKEEERERRHDEKRRLKRLEKERRRELEEERDSGLSREQERELERERLKQAKRERAQERWRREQEEQYTDNEHLSAGGARDQTYKDERRRRSKYAEVRTEESPRARKERSPGKDRSPGKNHARKKSRVVSGPYLEDGRSDEVYEYRKEKIRDEDSDLTTDSGWKKKRNRRICMK
jgi:glucan 1,3-beta-glucosidase